MPLPERRERFVAEYLTDHNATRAAVRAGYSPNGAAQAGSRLLSSVEVAIEVQRRSQAVARKLRVDHQMVVAGLMEAFEIARTKQDAKAMILACRELGKFCALYPEQGLEDRRAESAEAATVEGRILDEVPIETLEAMVLGSGARLLPRSRSEDGDS